LAYFKGLVADFSVHREKLREQHALGEEIANAITSTPMGEPIDDDELNEELENLEQEQLDNAMIGTGHVPVSDQVHRLPAAPNTESKFGLSVLVRIFSNTSFSQIQSPGTRGRRRRRAPKASGRDGHVTGITAFVIIGPSE
jgi:hypothetical protein